MNTTAQIELSNVSIDDAALIALRDLADIEVVMIGGGEVVGSTY